MIVNAPSANKPQQQFDPLILSHYRSRLGRHLTAAHANIGDIQYPFCAASTQAYLLRANSGPTTLFFCFYMFFRTAPQWNTVITNTCCKFYRHPQSQFFPYNTNPTHSIQRPSIFLTHFTRNRPIVERYKSSRNASTKS